MTPVLAISGLTIQTRRGGTTLVDNLSFEIAPGETVAVVGESGSGKSLTALSIMGLLPGPVRIAGGEIRFRTPSQTADLADLGERQFESLRGRNIGMVFQEPMSAFSQVKTVGDQVGEPLVRHAGLSRRAGRSQAAALLADLDVSEPERVAGQHPFELSGGMLQRAMIARAVACKPDLIIADEPTTSLDVTVQAQVLRLLARVQRSAGSAMLFITHDMAVARQVADRVVVMRRGTIVETGSASQVLAAPQAAYTKSLVAAVPRLDPREQTDHGTVADPILEIEGLSLAYAGSRPLFARPQPPKVAVQEVSLKLARGTVLGLVGESGSGKTTLARAVLHLAEPQLGRITFRPRSAPPVEVQRLDGRARKSYWRNVQMVFQNPYSSLNPWLSVEQALVEPLLHHGIVPPAQASERAARMLELCDLERDALPRFPHSFSGGQRQRIAIARALVTEPELVICDEPMSALDVSTQSRVADLLRKLRETLGLSILIITHDLAVASQLCDRIAVMHRGRLVEEGPTGRVFRAPAHAYTAGLLAAALKLEPIKEPS